MNVDNSSNPQPLNNSPPTAPIVRKGDTQGAEAKKDRINNLMSHAERLLEVISKQNASLHIELMSTILDVAKTKLDGIRLIAEKNINQTGKKGIDVFKKDLVKAEKEISKVVQDMQTDILLEKALPIAMEEAENKGIKVLKIRELYKKISTLAKGGVFTKILFQLLSCIKSYDLALTVFERTKFNMEMASQAPIKETDPSKMSQLEKDHLEEMTQFQSTGDLKRRTHIIGVEGSYRMKVIFSIDGIFKQFKSFVAQEQSRIKRTTITKTMTIEKAHYESKLVPLNGEFDKRVSVSNNGKPTTVFTGIVGEQGGIATGNRQEKHLINPWESTLTNEDNQVLYSAFRHAITSDKFETDQTIRDTNSKQAAKELVTAALLKTISERGMTLEEAKKYGITINLDSLSLVTPDSFRGHLGMDDERRMQEDQEKALRAFSGQHELEIDGVNIPVTATVNTFCFGVNSGAVKYGSYGMGLSRQSRGNWDAFSSVKDSTNHLLKAALILDDPSTPDEKDTMIIERQEAVRLLEDIEQLLESPTAYIEGGNQYEIGARILLLNQELNKIRKKIINKKVSAEVTKNELDPLSDKEKIREIRLQEENKIPIASNLVNCMSAKDRTSIQESVAKTLAILASQNHGHYPTHEEMMTNTNGCRDQFAQIFATVLNEDGGIEAAGINTGGVGLKLGEEARIWGLNLEAFAQAQGLGSTTAS